jgi:large subunit ribosomal protein L4
MHPKKRKKGSLQVPVHNISGEIVGNVELDDRVYDVPLNLDLLHQAMVYHQANQRQGTHSTKTRANVSGGGRKPWAQKGTGRARQGSIRSPQWRGGGIVFGPTSRSYRQSLPKKMRRQAIRCALSAKVRDGSLVLIEDFDWTVAKTKVMGAMLKALEVTSPALVVVPSPQRELALSIRNLPRVKALHADIVNVLDLLRYKILVMTVAAAHRTEEVWAHTEPQKIKIS